MRPVFSHGGLDVHDLTGPCLSVTLELDLEQTDARGVTLVDRGGDVLDPADFIPGEELEARGVRELRDALTEWLERVGRDS